MLLKIAHRGRYKLANCWLAFGSDVSGSISSAAMYTAYTAVSGLHARSRYINRNWCHEKWVSFSQWSVSDQRTDVVVEVNKSNNGRGHQLTYFFIVRFESRTTPRSRTASIGSMSTPPTRNGDLFVVANIWDEPTNMNWVFSAFSRSRFDDIHMSTSLMQHRSTAAEAETAEQLV